MAYLLSMKGGQGTSMSIAGMAAPGEGAGKARGYERHDGQSYPYQETI
jgi:hypothetical protein